MQAYRSSILEAKAGASQQKFHRDRGINSPLPRLLYGFASPMQVPLKGATTTIPGSHLTETDVKEGEEWKDWMMVIYCCFLATYNTEEMNNTTENRPLLTTVLDLEIS